MRRKKQKNYAGIIVSIFIAFIMITSVLGYIFADSTHTDVRFEGHKFTGTNSGWRTNIDGAIYTFTYLPQDILDLNISIDTSKFQVPEIDLTYMHNSTYKEGMARAGFELANKLNKKNIFVRMGFTEESPYEMPIITCADATVHVPVLYLKISNETKVTDIDNCITIEATNENTFVAYADLIVYKILGVL